MQYNKFIVCLCVLTLFLVFPLCSVQAGVVSVNFNMMYGTPSGTPALPAPWLNATFTDVSSGVVDMKITAVDLAAGEKIGDVCFNVNPPFDPANLLFSAPTVTGGTVGILSLTKGEDVFAADGDGYFDIHLAFDTTTAGAFSNGEAVDYTITLAGLTANSFIALSTPHGGFGPFYAAAHIQGLGTLQDKSAWVTTLEPPTVPEPTTIGLLGLGALALRRRK
jgi:hypothetical protein